MCYDYFRLVSYIPLQWKKSLEKLDDYNPIYNYDLLRDMPSTSAKIYTKLISNHSQLENYAIKWELKLQNNLEYEEYIKYFANLMRCTVSTKLKNFQYRLLLDKIVLNRQLYIWKIVNSDLCSWCKVQPKRTLHFFVQCPIAQSLWNSVHKLIQQKINYNDN